MPKLEVENLSFSYDGKPVIENITFSANSGEAWAVIGRNGAGKSTLLKCLCGLLRRSRGTVAIDGADIAALPPREIARSLAFVPQGNGRPAPPFTVREYVTMARFPYGNFFSLPSPKDKERVDEALALTDTARLAGRRMDTLSGGEFQAALVAGAVAQDTPILMLDEPTTFLDAYHQENIRLLIERIHTQLGTIVITVTHDVNLALSTHNNILALVDGKPFFCGARDEFCANAANSLSSIFSVDFCGVKSPGNKTFFFVDSKQTSPLLFNKTKDGTQ